MKENCLFEGSFVNNATQIGRVFFLNITPGHNRPRWPSGLSHHVSNSSRDRDLGPRFEYRLGHVYGTKMDQLYMLLDCDMTLVDLSEK